MNFYFPYLFNPLDQNNLFDEKWDNRNFKFPLKMKMKNHTDRSVEFELNWRLSPTLLSQFGEHNPCFTERSNVFLKSLDFEGILT